jgi:hypothetical protein
VASELISFSVRALFQAITLSNVPVNLLFAAAPAYPDPTVSGLDEWLMVVEAFGKVSGVVPK